MATGIVAIACSVEGLRVLARAFAALNVAAFAVLASMTLLRLVRFPRAFCHDLGDHRRGVGFFTIVAGMAVLGSDLVTVFGLYRLSLMLWLAGIALWAIFTYSIFFAIIVKQNKPSLGYGIHGGWLLAVVATEAIAQLALLLLPGLSGHQQPVLFLCLALWLCGGMLYMWMISLIFYRYTFFALVPSDLLPSCWIDMGAMAIATVVGALLAEKANGSPFGDLAPFIKGFTILFWAVATWWFPVLVILSVWRVIKKHFSLVYDPLSWGAVFPLGMYAVATYHLAKLTGVAVLFVIPSFLVYVAVAAWVAVASEMMIAIGRRS